MDRIPTPFRKFYEAKNKGQYEEREVPEDKPKYWNNAPKEDEGKENDQNRQKSMKSTDWTESTESTKSTNIHEVNEIDGIDKYRQISTK